MNQLAKQPAVAGNFIALLQGKTGGVTLAQLDAELAELVTKVQTSGRKGTLTYKITVLPNAKMGVRIEDQVDVKEPKLEQAVRNLKDLLKDTEKARDRAQSGLYDLERRVREQCAYSVLLRAEGKVDRHTREVPIEERLHYARYENREISRIYEMPVESLMHLVGAHPTMGDDFRRCVHFRVMNPPGKPDFQVGYAVSHRELQMLRGRRYDFVRLIAENIAAHVSAQLFPKEDK